VCKTKKQKNTEQNKLHVNAVIQQKKDGGNGTLVRKEHQIGEQAKKGIRKASRELIPFQEKRKKK